VHIPDLQTLRPSPARDRVEILDQTRLPHARVTVSLATATDAAQAKINHIRSDRRGPVAGQNIARSHPVVPTSNLPTRNGR